MRGSTSPLLGVIVRALLFLPLLLISCLTSREDYQLLLRMATDHDLDGVKHPDHGGDDCDDWNADVYPGAPELCDNLDNDCDQLIDEGVQRILYVDDDGDGFGDPERAQGACVEGLGLVAEGGDCDDADEAVYPGAAEVCDNGVDDDCSGDAAGCRWEGEMDLYDADSFWRGIGAGDHAIYPVVADLNGDGHDDLVVGAPTADTANGIGSGAIYGVYGPLPEGTHTFSEADLELLGSERGAQLGFQDTFTFLDVTQDGVAELLLADNSYDYFGAYYGSVEIIPSEAMSTGEPSHILYSDLPSTGFRGFLYTVGDISGDGQTDLAVSLGRENSNGANSRTFAILHMPIIRDTNIESAESFIQAASVSEQLMEVRAGGDINGDGLHDLLVSAEPPETGNSAVSVFHGPIRGDLTSADADAVVRGPYQAQASWWSLAPRALGDVDGDGYDDLAVSAPFASVSASFGGASYVFYGPLSGASALGDAEASYLGDIESGYSGSLSGPGDLDGDGNADLVVNHRSDASIAITSFPLLLFFGPVAGTLSAESAHTSIQGSAAFGAGNTTTAPPPVDWNQDGLMDLTLAFGGDDLERGGVAVFFGSGG